MRKLDVRFAINSVWIAAVIAALFPAPQASAQFLKLTRLPNNNATARPQQPTSQPQPNANQTPVLQQAPAHAAVPLTDEQFFDLLNRAIEITSKRYLTANSHSPWQIFHYVLATRQEGVLRLGKEKVNAIQWISTAEPQFDNQPWLLLTPHGAKFHPYTKKYYFEGHPAQFLALLSHSNLPMDYPFHVQGKVVALKDLVNNTMKEVNTHEEVTWVLWALQHFLEPDASWVNQQNEQWSIERLVKIETGLPVVGTPCGGNHRLFALTRARDKYLQRGGQLRGTWLQADQKIKQHIEIARSLQNSDGTFSGKWYEGPLLTNDVNLRFNTTGHTMEFLSVALPNERLNEQWVRNAVAILSRELITYQNTQIDCGPLFHTLDALILYRDRVRPPSAAPQAIEKPAEIASPKPELPLSLNLKTAPDPVAVVTPDKTAAVTDANPSSTAAKAGVETKPMADGKSAIETKSVAQKPAEKSSVPSASPTIPIPEPAPLPELKAGELKAGELKVEAPKASDAQAKSPKADLGKAQVTVTKSNLPKIDPTKLANIGQAAPVSKSDEHSSASQRVTLRTRPADAPGLLPDLSATPLAEPKSNNTKSRSETSAAPDGEDTPNERIPLPPVDPPESEEGCSEPAANPGTADATQSEHLTIPDTTEEIDEPASALDVVNPS